MGPLITEFGKPRVSGEKSLERPTALKLLPEGVNIPLIAD